MGRLKRLAGIKSGLSCCFLEVKTLYFGMINTIVIVKDGVPIGTWGSITEISRQYDFVKYQSVKDRKFPFHYKGHTFYKFRFREKY